MAPASTRPRIAGARKAVIQSRPAGLMVSLRRASVIMPRSPTSTTRSSAKRPLILLTWLSSVEGSADIALEDLDRHRASLGGAKKPKHDLQLAFAVAIVTELRRWAGAALKVGRRDVVEHQRAVLQVAAGQRVLDALLLIDEPIEGLIKFLLIDRCEAQHRAERTVRRLRIEQARRRQLGYWIKQPCDDHGEDNDTLRAGCRPPCDSTRSSLSLRSVPSAAATCPCGRLRSRAHCLNRNVTEADRHNWA